MHKSDDQEKLAENKFFYDSDMDFQVQARASKLFGLWAADKLGLVGEDAEKYALKAVNIKVQTAGFSDLIDKIAGDLNNKEISVSKHLLGTEMEKALSVARANGVLTTIE